MHTQKDNKNLTSNNTLTLTSIIIRLEQSELVSCFKKTHLHNSHDQHKD